MNAQPPFQRAADRWLTEFAPEKSVPDENRIAA